MRSVLGQVGDRAGAHGDDGRAFELPGELLGQVEGSLGRLIGLAERVDSCLIGVMVSRISSWKRPPCMTSIFTLLWG